MRSVSHEKEIDIVFHRLLTGVIFPHDESFLDDVGVGVLLSLDVTNLVVII